MKYLDSVIDNIKTNYDELFAAEKKIADYILEKNNDIVSLNVSELAEQSGASDATVIRFCKHLGYKGFYNMKLQLAHDFGRDQILGGDESSSNPKTAEEFIKRQAQNILNISGNIDMKTLDDCVEMILNCDTAHLVAAGNSIPTASDFAFRLGRAGVRTTSPYLHEHQLNAINLGTSNDIVIGVSHSGSSTSVLQAFQLAKERGMKTMAIVDLKRSPLSKEANLTLETGMESSSVFIFGAESHMYLTAVLDMLIFMVSRRRIDDDGGRVEILLSESKI